MIIDAGFVMITVSCVAMLHSCDVFAVQAQRSTGEPAPLVAEVVSCDQRSIGVLVFEVRNTSSVAVEAPLHVLPSTVSPFLDFAFNEIESKLDIVLDRVDAIDDSLATVTIDPGEVYRVSVDLKERYPGLPAVVTEKGTVIHWSIRPVGSKFPIERTCGFVTQTSNECRVHQ